MINLSKLHDLIYAKADRLFKQYNPCNIHIDKRKQLVCNNPKYDHNKPNQQLQFWNSLCCIGCEYLGNNGCTTKCLGCKVGLCCTESRYWITEDAFDDCCETLKVNKVFRKKLQRLAHVANKYKLVKLHSTKTDLKSLQFLFPMYKREKYYE